MRKKDIFISHTWRKDLLGRNNHLRCKNLCNKLKSFGYTTWFDDFDMETDIDNSIINGIKNCKVFLVCLTIEYCKKINNAVKYNKLNDNCYKEWNCAINNNKNIIPIIMEPKLLDTFNNFGIVSMYLSSIIYIDMSNDISQNFKKLCKLLNFCNVHTKLECKILDFNKKLSFNKLIKNMQFKKNNRIKKPNIIYI